MESKKQSEQLIASEVQKFVTTVETAITSSVRKIAIDEAWRLLQISIAAIIQIIEGIGNDLSGPEKKQLAITLISDLYDRVFIVVDIPYLPNVLESYLHKYIKQFLMILVGSSIDSMVTIFRNTGVFLKKQSTEV